MDKQFFGWLTSMPDTVVFVWAATRGKAKSLVYAVAVDAFGKRAVQFTQVRVKKA
jgi:hypothetical protein